MLCRYVRFLTQMMGVLCCGLPPSCTAERLERFTRPVSVYVERTDMDTEFDPRDLNSDGEGITVGISYDLSEVLYEPLTAESLVKQLARWQPSIAQNVSVDQRQDAPVAHVELAQDPEPLPNLPPCDEPVGPPAPHSDEGWGDPSVVFTALGTMLVLLITAVHSKYGLPGTVRRQDKRAAKASRRRVRSTDP